MIETLDLNYNGYNYQVEIDVENMSDVEDEEETVTLEIDIIDIYMIKKRHVYRVTNVYIWEGIEELDLLEMYIDQCM